MLNQNPDCIFCKIIGGEISGTIRYQDENWLVFDDINKIAPEHVLVVPKKHIATLEDVPLDDKNFHADLLLTARKVAKEIGISDNYKIFMNVGKRVQMVHHIHAHVYGGWSASKSDKEIDSETDKFIH